MVNSENFYNSEKAHKDSVLMNFATLVYEARYKKIVPLIKEIQEAIIDGDAAKVDKKKQSLIGTLYQNINNALKTEGTHREDFFDSVVNGAAADFGQEPYFSSFLLQNLDYIIENCPIGLGFKDIFNKPERRKIYQDFGVEIDGNFLVSSGDEIRDKLSDAFFNVDEKTGELTFAINGTKAKYFGSYVWNAYLDIEGYSQKYYNMARALIDKVDENGYMQLNGKKVKINQFNIAGHSLGAAVATNIFNEFAHLWADKNVKVHLTAMNSPGTALKPNGTFHKLLDEGKNPKLKEMVSSTFIGCETDPVSTLAPKGAAVPTIIKTVCHNVKVVVRNLVAPHIFGLGVDPTLKFREGPIHSGFAKEQGVNIKMKGDGSFVPKTPYLFANAFDKIENVFTSSSFSMVARVARNISDIIKRKINLSSHSSEVNVYMFRKAMENNNFIEPQKTFEMPIHKKTEIFKNAILATIDEYARRNESHDAVKASYVYPAAEKAKQYVKESFEGLHKNTSPDVAYKAIFDDSILAQMGNVKKVNLLEKFVNFRSADDYAVNILQVASKQALQALDVICNPTCNMSIEKCNISGPKNHGWADKVMADTRLFGTAARATEKVLKASISALTTIVTEPLKRVAKIVTPD